MPFSPFPLAAACASPDRAPGAGAEAARPRLRATLEALILSLLATLLGRARRRDAIWHPIPTQLPPVHTATPQIRLASDGTHAACESPILYVIGPGPGRGMRPLPRALPHPRLRTARAPPVRAPTPHLHPPENPSRGDANPRP